MPERTPERAQEDDAYRKRMALLRDYESTKLSQANFCVLKGIASSDLDGLLAQARQEAAERAKRQPVAPPANRGVRPGPGGERSGFTGDRAGYSSGRPHAPRDQRPGGQIGRAHV